MEIALWSVAQKIASSGGHNRGPWPEEYARAVGLDPLRGYPWCTSAWYSIYKEAARQKRVVNPFPRTAKAVSVWDLVDSACKDSNPGVGAHYILDHGGQWASELGSDQPLTDNGHFGACVTLDGPDCATEVSANTNAEGSRTGGAWWVHEGTPEVTHKGVLIGWVYFDRATTRSLVT